MEYVAFLSLAFGYAAGATCSYRGAAWLISMVHRKSLKTTSQARFVKLLGIIGAIGAAIPGFLLATFVGGTLGGGYGELASIAVGAGGAGTFVGLALGVCGVFAFTVCVGATCGAMIGWLLSRLSCRQPTA